MPICLSYHVCSIRPCGAPSPGGEGYDTRIPSSKKVAHHPCEPIRSPSTVIPSAAEGSLLHCRHMHACARIQTTPWCFLFRLFLTHGLPVCKKDPSTSVGMTRTKDGLSHIVFHISPFPRSRFTGLQERSLHFGRDDTHERRIVSHRLSYRCVEGCPCGAYPSCAFGAAHLQGPTRIVGMTGDL